MLTTSIYDAMGSNLGNPYLAGNVTHDLSRIGARAAPYTRTIYSEPVQQQISPQLQQELYQQQLLQQQLLQQQFQQQPQKVKVDLGIPGMQYPRPYPFQMPQMASMSPMMPMNPEMNYIQQEKMRYQQKMDEMKRQRVMSNIMSTLSSKNPNFQVRQDYFRRKDMRSMFKIKGGGI